MESSAGIDSYSDDDDDAAVVASSSEDEDSFTFGGSPSSSRLPHRREMSEARWDAEMGIAEVIVRKGKAWHSTGFSRGGRLLAHVEEAVYMVEQGSLVLREGEKVMPLVDAYSLLASQGYGCSWDAFQTYSYLKNLGYIVGRYNVPWSFSTKKKQPPLLTTSASSDIEELQTQFAATDLANMDTTLKETSQTSSKSSDSVQEVMKQELSLMYDVHLPNSHFKKTAPGLPVFCLCITSDHPPKFAEVQALVQSCRGRPVKFAAVDCGHVSIFSFDTVTLPMLPDWEASSCR
ncbi:unnamed protein product [Sphagnum tenellum]